MIIRMADIFLAIEAKDLNPTILVGPFDHPGELAFVFITNQYLRGLYNLKQDNLDDQSDELKQFLFDVLVEGGV